MTAKIVIDFLLVLGTGITVAAFWGIVLYVICEDLISEGVNNRARNRKTRKWQSMRNPGKQTDGKNRSRKQESARRGY